MHEIDEFAEGERDRSEEMFQQPEPGEYVRVDECYAILVKLATDLGMSVPEVAQSAIRHYQQHLYDRAALVTP